jgi:hypothetical protein
VDLCLSNSLKGSRYPLAHIGIYAKARLFVQRPRVVVKTIEVRIQDTGLAPVGMAPQRRFDSVYIGGSSSDWEKNVVCAQDIAEINNIIVECPGTAMEISPVTQYFFQRSTLKELLDFLGMDSKKGKALVLSVLKQIHRYDDEAGKANQPAIKKLANSSQPKIETVKQAAHSHSKVDAGTQKVAVAASPERVAKRMQRIEKEAERGENAYEIPKGKEAWSGGAGGKIRFGVAKPLVEAGTTSIVKVKNWSGVNQRVVNPKIDHW